jgi:hypothetical protein
MLAKPFRPFVEYYRYVCIGFNIVKYRRLCKQSFICRERSLGLGIPLCPSIEAIRAVSSPHTKAPAPSLNSISNLKPVPLYYLQADHTALPGLLLFRDV